MKEQPDCIGVYSVYDGIADDYSPPIVSACEAQVRRDVGLAFSSVIGNEDNCHRIHLTALRLFRIGQWLPKTGEFISDGRSEIASVQALAIATHQKLRDDWQKNRADMLSAARSEPLDLHKSAADCAERLEASRRERIRRARRK